MERLNTENYCSELESPYLCFWVTQFGLKYIIYFVVLVNEKVWTNAFRNILFFLRLLCLGKNYICSDTGRLILIVSILGLANIIPLLVSSSFFTYRNMYKSVRINIHKRIFYNATEHNIWAYNFQFFVASYF